MEGNLIGFEQHFLKFKVDPNLQD